MPVSKGLSVRKIMSELLQIELFVVIHSSKFSFLILSRVDGLPLKEIFKIDLL
jgi:hypothetical protein